MGPRGVRLRPCLPERFLRWALKGTWCQPSGHCKGDLELINLQSRKSIGLLFNVSSNSCKSSLIQRTTVLPFREAIKWKGKPQGNCHSQSVKLQAGVEQFSRELRGHLQAPESRGRLLESHCLKAILHGQVSESHDRVLGSLGWELESYSQELESCDRALGNPPPEFEVPLFTSLWPSTILAGCPGSAVCGKR